LALLLLPGKMHDLFSVQHEKVNRFILSLYSGKFIGRKSSVNIKTSFKNFYITRNIIFLMWLKNSVKKKVLKKKRGFEHPLTSKEKKRIIR